MSPLDTPTRASKADEIDLALTGPDTPGGTFMRQFWIAVERAEDVPCGQARPIRIMGEDFAVYRGETGRAQVIAYRCPHRGAQMHLGWVEGDDIRCVYHGWKFDGAGRCLEQPAEEAGFARKVKIRTCPTREHMGLIYAYFGPGPEEGGHPPAFFTAIQHPDRVRVQDVAVQAGQGMIADRAHEHLGRSDTAIILWRKILARECRAIAEGRPAKRWTPAPRSVVPTLGF